MKNALFAAALALAVLPIAANGQVVVYNVDFDAAGPSANYRGYDSGFFVMPLNGGNVDFVLQFQEGSTRYFVQAPELGTYFIATEGNERQGVIANATGTGTPVNFFMALGELDTTVSANISSTDAATNVTTTTRETAQLPKRLEGFILTADPSGAGIFDANSGAAGASEISAAIDLVRTNSANLQGQTEQEVVAEIVAALERAGQQEFVVEIEEETEPDANAAAAAAANAAPTP